MLYTVFTSSSKELLAYGTHHKPYRTESDTKLFIISASNQKKTNKKKRFLRNSVWLINLVSFHINILSLFAQDRLSKLAFGRKLNISLYRPQRETEMKMQKQKQNLNVCLFAHKSLIFFKRGLLNNRIMSDFP